jgi:hypothetical protein
MNLPNWLSVVRPKAEATQRTDAEKIIPQITDEDLSLGGKTI